MPDLFPPALDDQIAAVERECKLRRSVYPRRVADGKMTGSKRRLWTPFSQR